MKKPLVAILVGLILGGAVFGGYLAWLGSKPKPVIQKTVTKQNEVQQFLTWRDPNGFSFQYPDGLTVNKHNEDKENYAHIEFTHPDHPGNVIVWGKDTTAADATAWAKTEKRFKGASTLDTTFANVSGKKVLIAAPSQIIVGTVDDSIAWTVEGLLTDSAFWTGVHTTIADSFKFIPVGSVDEEDSTAPVQEAVSADEEEVIE
ncbi:hypothetical protein A2971_00330 [Candidatus Gottesmanbacteria bacterium RIFCSPLOWO2_01_FULL_46_21]|uniref:Uncharacterized protein n=1 Tax=Candidatus Gottesmanbacteria bacterium RIFCSPLOWO2_01_FULL_46_21 TaxID=1798393 RepID=A0A1F6AWY3_9BACT|nr:MAG: hypothetical protein A2971_00330 [Candidatus Gottesmanbacteria bacterium RIFCSPLOWO2_01_FULL_46_21]